MSTRNSVIVTFILTILLITGCSKKDSVDERDKFIGTWKGTLIVTIPSLNYSDSDFGTFSITKSSSNSKEILVDTDAATVNGESYTYVGTTETFNDPTLGAVTASFNGNGIYSGNGIAETGTIKYVVLGVAYNGTWTRILTKQ